MDGVYVSSPDCDRWVRVYTWWHWFHCVRWCSPTIWYILLNPNLVGSIGTTISGAIIRDFTKLDRTTPITMVWLVGASATDIVITISLVWYLVRYFSPPYDMTYPERNIVEEQDGFQCHGWPSFEDNKRFVAVCLLAINNPWQLFLSTQSPSRQGCWQRPLQSAWLLDSAPVYVANHIPLHFAHSHQLLCDTHTERHAYWCWSGDPCLSPLLYIPPIDFERPPRLGATHSAFETSERYPHKYWGRVVEYQVRNERRQRVGCRVAETAIRERYPTWKWIPSLANT